MIKRNRRILKITSAVLFVLAIFSAIPLVTSMLTILTILGQLTASQESLQLILYTLIIALLGIVSFVVQLMAAVKGWKAGSGKDYSDNCKTYGTLLIILQIASIVINILLGGFEASQIVGNGLSLLLLFLYTYSASKLIY